MSNLHKKINFDIGSLIGNTPLVELRMVNLPDRGDRYLSTTLFRSVCACCPP